MTRKIILMLALPVATLIGCSAWSLVSQIVWEATVGQGVEVGLYTALILTEGAAIGSIMRWTIREIQR